MFRPVQNSAKSQGRRITLDRTIKRESLVALGLTALALLCYATVLPAYFLSDDFTLIGRIAGEGMFYTWGNASGGFLRPGTVFSYWVDYHIWGLNPVGYHLTNVLFHAGAAYALYLVSYSLFGTAGLRNPRTLSLLAACLFVALSSHSESVSWIAGRTDVIAIALGLAATAAFLLLLESGSLLSAGLALVLLSGALLTKESAIVLPPIWCLLFGYQWWAKGARPSTGSLITLGIGCILLTGYFGLRKATLGHFIGGYGTQVHISILNVRTLLNLYHFGLRTFLPALPLRFQGMGSLPWLLASAIVTGGLAAGLALRRKTLPEGWWHLLALLILCYLASLIPAATMRMELFDTRGERFLYLPSAFACIAAASIVGILIKRRIVQGSVLAVLVLVQALSLQWVNTRWRTASILSEQIAREVSQTDPNTTIVLNVPDNYRGAYLFRNGLRQAATFFVGADPSSRYQRISTHDLNSMRQVVQAEVTGSQIVLTLPEGLRFREVREGGFEIMGGGRFLYVSAGDDQNTDGLTFLSFTSGSTTPMLRRIEWNPRGDQGRPLF